MKVEYDEKLEICTITIERNEIVRAFTSVGAYNDLIANISKQFYEKGQKL